MTQSSITCPQCGRTSYHPKDIKFRFCGHCHLFHNTMENIVPNPRPIDLSQLADFVLLGCLFAPYAKLGYTIQRAVDDPGFRLRYTYWRGHQGKSAFALVDDARRARERAEDKRATVQMHRGNTTPH